MAKGLVWTPSRVNVLLDVYAFNRAVSKGVEKAAAVYISDPRNRAVMLGASVDEVSSWLERSPGSRGASAAIPVERLESFLSSCRPGVDDYVREADWKRNAFTALDRLYVRRLVPFQRWRELHWLDPYRVYVTSAREVSGLLRIGSVRVGTDREKPYRYLANSVVVRNRFEAELVKLAVLSDVDPARLVVGIGKGKTHTWIADARVPNLELIRDRVLKEL